MTETARTDTNRVGRIVYRERPATPRPAQSGYGTSPTEFLIQYRADNGRLHWHRVFAMSYGNGATLYIRSGGRTVLLDIDTQHKLAAAREGK